MRPYEPGRCAACGEQLWVTDHRGMLVAPLPEVYREVYLVFEPRPGESHCVRVPVCVTHETCQDSTQWVQWIERVRIANALGDPDTIAGQQPLALVPYAELWRARGKRVVPIWEQMRTGAPSMQHAVRHGPLGS